MRKKIFFSVVATIICAANVATLTYAQGTGCDPVSCDVQSDCTSKPKCDLCQPNPIGGPHCASDGGVE